MIRETFPPPPPPPPTFWISDSAEDTIWFLETIHRPRERGGREKGRGRRNVENAHKDPSFLPPVDPRLPKNGAGFDKDGTAISTRAVRHVRHWVHLRPRVSRCLIHPTSLLPPPRSILPQGTEPGSFPPAGDDRSLRRPIHPRGRGFNNSKKRSLLSFPLGEKSCYVRHFAKKQKRQFLNF